MVLIHQRAPPAKGDHPQNWWATDPSTSGHQPHNWSSRRYFFNVEFGGHVPEVSSTSRSMASRRSVPRVVLRPVGGCGQAMLSQYGFPWYAVRSTVSSGILFSLCVLVVYFHVSSSSSCVSRLERWQHPCGGWSFRTSRSSVSVLFMVLPGLSRIVVFGVAPLLTGRRKSPRRVCFWVTRRGPIGTSEICA